MECTAFFLTKRQPTPMRTHRDQHTITRLGIFLLLSLASHALVLWCMQWLPASDMESSHITSPAKKQPQKTRTAVRMISESSLPSNLQRKNQVKEQKDPKQEKKKKKTPTTQDTNYVYRDSLIREQQPDEARFSGRQAQRAERETQKKRANPGASPQQIASVARKGVEDAQINQRPSPSPDTQTPPSSSQQREQEFKETQQPDVVLPGKAQPKDVPSADLLVQNTPGSSGPTKGTEQGKDTGNSPDKSTIFPSKQQSMQFADQLGDNGSFQYLKDVEEGDVTLLNQKRNRYWTFWDRMIRKVRREWNPKKEYRQRDPYGNVYGVGNFLTSVDVTLSADGSVHKLRVSKSSDIDFLDKEAVRALLQAGPYPNPPEGLKDEDGLIHFKFNFNLEIMSGSVKLIDIKPEEPF